MLLTIHEINTISKIAIFEKKLSFISGIDLLARTKNLKAVVKLSERHIIQIWEFKAKLFKKQKSKSPGAIHTWNNCIPTITNTQIPIWTEKNCYQTESNDYMITTYQNLVPSLEYAEYGPKLLWICHIFPNSDEPWSDNQTTKTVRNYWSYRKPKAIFENSNWTDGCWWIHCLTQTLLLLTFSHQVMLTYVCIFDDGLIFGFVFWHSLL